MLWQIVVTLLAIALMDRLGRRMLLLIASSVMAISACGLAYHFLARGGGGERLLLDIHTTTAERGGERLPSPPWIAVLMVVMYITGFGLGMGPVPWIIMSDIFLPEVAAIGSALATSANWASSFLVTFTFEGLQHRLTPAGTFLLYGSVCSLCFAFVKAMLPETKGKSVEEVLEALGHYHGAKVAQPAETAEPENTGLLNISPEAIGKVSDATKH